MDTNNPTHKRQDWLERAWSALRKELVEDAPPAATIWIGFPNKKRNGKDLNFGEVYVECLVDASGQFGIRNVVVLHPFLLDRPIDLLVEMLHQMLHCALDPDVKAHGKEFQDRCTRIGLEKPWTAPQPNDRLHKVILGIAADLGPLPAGSFTPPPPPERKPKPKVQLLCNCTPPRKLPVSAKFLETGSVMCGACRSPFRTVKQDGLAGESS